MRVLLQFPGRGVAEWRAALAAALPEAEISVWPDHAGAADYALVWKPPPELFVGAPPLKAIFNIGAGVDALMRVANLPATVPIIRLEDAGMAAQMAEYVTLAVLRAYREFDRYARQQGESLWAPHRRAAKGEFGVGILGLGVLGRAVAEALRPFGFPLSGWSRTRKSIDGVRSFAGNDGFAAFMAQARVLVCLLPSTPQTRDLVDAAAMSRLPRGAHVINIARGDIIVDADLVRLLDDGHLSGATLDVFREEPLPAGHPFWHHPGIVMTPHISAATLIEDSVAQIARKIRRLEQGLAVTGAVDRALGY